MSTGDFPYPYEFDKTNPTPWQQTFLSNTVTWTSNNTLPNMNCPVNFIPYPPCEPKNSKCRYCRSLSEIDKRGNCICCGAPKEK